jgi:diguanylate cyclase (GGDEF)-like protein
MKDRSTTLPPELARVQEDLEAERARRHAGEFGRAVLEAAFAKLDSGVLVLDADRVLFANPALGEIIGVPAESLLQMTRDQFLREIAGLFDEPPELLRRLKERSSLTVEIREEFDIQRPRWRRLRWVCKPLRLPSGRGQLGLFTDITTDADVASAREERALTDQLTDLSNRRAGERSVAREVARAQRTGRPLSFVMFDVDHFKRVNDTHGHLVGDAVLKKVSGWMIALLRAGDIAVRWGGEEFLAILADTNLDEARRFGDRVRRQIEEVDFGEIGPITISGGVAEYRPGEAPEETIARADVNLYQAKAMGRNRVV